MASGVALAAAKVTGPAGGPFDAVQVIARANRVVLSKPGMQPVSAGYTALERTGPREWRLTVDAGAVWVVTKEKGCGCGR